MHPPAFTALRDAILGLPEDNRKRLAALLGCMHGPRPPLSGELTRVLAAIAALDPADRGRLAKWCASYLSRWGQVPAASSRRVKPT
jgi:hypothetical protein